MRAAIIRRVGIAVGAACLAALSGCAHFPADEPSDPLETVNRGIFKFNRGADRYLLRPVAKGYHDYVPDPIRRGIGNVLSNFFYPTVIVNDVLQGKFSQGGKDLGRFIINTTAGLAGIMDVATPLGLPPNNEDLGQTLGRWGAGEGLYLMLPLLGPSDGRDFFGRVGDAFTSSTGYVEGREGFVLTGATAVDARARLLGADHLLDEQLDPYVFIRTTYLQRRQSLVYDGNPPPEVYDFDE
ncbi:MAG: MlaA family lipoprotein [Panacagrimonas sp.]